MLDQGEKSPDLQEPDKLKSTGTEHVTMITMIRMMLMMSMMIRTMMMMMSMMTRMMTMLTFERLMKEVY